MTNKHRIDQTARTLIWHRHDGRGTAPSDEDVADLLADLRHYCDHAGLDFSELNERGFRYYLEERCDE